MTSWARYIRLHGRPKVAENLILGGGLQSELNDVNRRLIVMIPLFVHTRRLCGGRCRPSAAALLSVEPVPFLFIIFRGGFLPDFFQLFLLAFPDTLSEIHSIEWTCAIEQQPWAHTLEIEDVAWMTW